MANPFQKRATEYLTDDNAFLSVVTPEPLHTYLEIHAKDGSLYDRLTLIIGTPGSGKTTIARLFQYRTVETLWENSSKTEHRTLKAALSKCGVYENDRTKIAACRISLESEYRDFWQLPYDDELKSGLLLSLIQARAVIGWIKNFLAEDRYELSEIKLIPREDAGAALEQIGGIEAASIFERAKAVEKAIYEINAALIAPPVHMLKKEAIDAYHPFDVIENFQLQKKGELQLDANILKPLVILDDAHILHTSQLDFVVKWLARREVKIARWAMMRIDALTPSEVFAEISSDQKEAPGSTIKRSREITFIAMQGHDNRRTQRRNFQAMAKDMADKYIRKMPLLTKQGINSFTEILDNFSKEIPTAKKQELRKKIESEMRDKSISIKEREMLTKKIGNYIKAASNPDIGEDVQLAMLRILLHRYAKKAGQKSLFEEFEDTNEEEMSEAERNAPEPNAGVQDGARIFLLHEYNKPYYYGLDTLCNGSSENAEQFLQLAGSLVEHVETKIIRNPNVNASLPVATQNTILRQHAQEIINEWSFPNHKEVRALCDFIAAQCIEKSLEPNASLGGGPIGFGIPQDEFNEIPQKHPALSRIMKYGYAYNALSIKPNHLTKKRHWCLIELGGPVLISKGLTLTRGGFLERRVTDLLKALGEA